MDKTTIPLKSPVEVNGHTYSELSMREPTVEDSLTAKKQGASSAEEEVTLFSNLCEVPPEVIRKLKLKDYFAAQKVYKDFLS